MPLQMTEDEARAWFALLRTPGLGAAGVRQLLEHAGDACAALEQARRLQSGSAARAWLRQPDATRLDADLEWLAQPANHLLAWGSDEYPPLLLDAPNPPAALFVVGDPACLWFAQIAIVGSRNATRDGRDNAQAFARTLALAGNGITSGLAEGVDRAAHEGALEARGRTIAVLGTGPDRVFPRQHEALARRVAAGGALVSEFPPGTPGLPQHFPRRNRIIAGLALGTLVVEAGLRSGSLGTARCAAEAGREVFALPGSIHSPLARGCHKLIRDGAKLVETAEQVLEELHGVGARLAVHLRERLAQDGDAAAELPQLRPPAPSRDAEYQRLLECLDARAVPLDEIVARSGMSAAALSSMLLVLELDGAVVAEDGCYARR